MDIADPEEVALDLTADDERELASPIDPAAEAFARLEGEMAMMRRAVQQLASERADIVIPDYGPTLSSMAKSLGAISGSIDDIAEHPAMQVTPESFGERIEAAADWARRPDQDRINHARQELYDATNEIRTVAARARTAEEQHRRQHQCAGIGVLVGILLWSFLPGTIARALPSSWQLPERMARRVVDQPTILDAGIHLIRMADPGTWEAIVDAAALNAGNRAAIKRCKAAAVKAKRPVDCKVRVDH